MRPRNLLSGMRARIVLMTALMTAVSMAVLTLMVAVGVRSTLEAQERDYLVERLDVAQALVEGGDLAGALDASGPVVLQVLDARGRVLASSAHVLDNTPVVKVERDDDDDDAPDADDAADPDDDSDEGQGSDASRGASGGSAGAVSPTDDDDAYDDIDDADDVADADDADDDWDDADDWDDDADDDWDDDADAIIWPQRRLASLIRAQMVVSVPSGGHLAPEVEEVLSRQLGVAAPYMVSTRAVTYDGSPATIVALASMASAAQAATSALRLLTVLSALVVIGAAALSWALVGRILRPVEQMRASTAVIVESTPSQRLIVPTGDRDLRELAATFNDLLQRSELALVEQRRFVSDASHQLKSPLAAQRVMIETLREHPDAADRDAVLDDLAQENNRLQGIVADLLALARYDEGQLPTFTSVDLIDVVFEEVASLAAHASVPVDTSGVMPAVVRGDAHQLGQALRNLLDNASRYARTTVRVTCADEGDLARIVVSDDGPGIAPEDRERVFERFVRLEEGRDTARGSTGLGLAVVKGIVESHGGRVWFEESSEGGAAAVVELPTA